MVDNRVNYTNFNISSFEKKNIVDNFFEKLNEPNLILYNFWKKDFHTICFSNIENLEELLFLFGNIDSQYYIYFKDYLTYNIYPYQLVLENKKCQEFIENGHYVFNITLESGEIITIDISDLKQFNFWVNLVRNLLMFVIKNILSELRETVDRIDKALVVKKLYGILIQYRHLISDTYSICKNCTRFYFYSIKKLLEFVHEGAEFAIYTFAILYPDMMNNSGLLKVNKFGSLYEHSRLKIDKNDKLFSEIYKKYREYYITTSDYK
jgi:hypothetical protein